MLYVTLWRKLNALVLAGDGDSKVAEEIRAEMDELWNSMSSAEVSNALGLIEGPSALATTSRLRHDLRHLVYLLVRGWPYALSPERVRRFLTIMMAPPREEVTAEKLRTKLVSQYLEAGGVDLSLVQGIGLDLYTALALAMLSPPSPKGGAILWAVYVHTRMYVKATIFMHAFGVDVTSTAYMQAYRPRL